MSNEKKKKALAEIGEKIQKNLDKGQGFGYVVGKTGSGKLFKDYYVESDTDS